MRRDTVWNTVSVNEMGHSSVYLVGPRRPMRWVTDSEDRVGQRDVSLFTRSCWSQLSCRPKRWVTVYMIVLVTVIITHNYYVYYILMFFLLGVFGIMCFGILSSHSQTLTSLTVAYFMDGSVS